jgi:hypothetical protein
LWILVVFLINRVYWYYVIALMLSAFMYETGARMRDYMRRGIVSDSERKKEEEEKQESKSQNDSRNKETSR